MKLQKAVGDIIVWRGFNLLSAFILNIVLARLLGASGTGLVFLNMAYLSFFVLIISFSVESGLGFYVASNKVTTSVATSIGLLVFTLSSLIALIFLQAYSSLYSDIEEMKWPTLYFITGTVLTNIFSGLFFAQKKFHTPNIILGVINLLLISIFLIIGGGRQYYTLLIKLYYSSFFVQGALLVLFFFRKNPILKKELSLEKPFVGILKYSLIALSSNIVFFLVYRISYWFVSEGSSAEVLGNYIQVSKLVQWFLILPSMLATVVFPLTASNIDKMHISIPVIVRVLFLFSIIICCLLGGTGYLVFPFVFGDTFFPMYLLFLLHIPGIVALAGLVPLSAYHAGRGRLRVNLYGGIVALGIVLLGGFIFVPIYGVFAAAVINSVAYFANLVFSLLAYKRDTAIPLRSFINISSKDFSFFRPIIK